MYLRRSLYYNIYKQTTDRFFKIKVKTIVLPTNFKVPKYKVTVFAKVSLAELF